MNTTFYFDNETMEHSDQQCRKCGTILIEFTRMSYSSPDDFRQVTYCNFCDEEWEQNV